MFNQFMQTPAWQQPVQGFQNNPYQSRLDALQQQAQPRYEITRVNGKNGADAYRLPPNSQILLLDESAPIVWLKQTDGAGYATVTPYTIAPYQEAPAPDYNSLNERISRLEALLDGKPDSSNAKQKRKSADAEAE